MQVCKDVCCFNLLLNVMEGKLLYNLWLLKLLKKIMSLIIISIMYLATVLHAGVIYTDIYSVVDNRYRSIIGNLHYNRENFQIRS